MGHFFSQIEDLARIKIKDFYLVRRAYKIEDFVTQRSHLGNKIFDFVSPANQKVEQPRAHRKIEDFAR
jgi:hypothetical protein